MVYDADPRTIEWFESALGSPSPRVRWRAIELLREVDGPRRREWLQAAEGDSDPRVSATAVIVGSLVRGRAELVDGDLFESDFADGAQHDPMGWEWEYCVLVCRGPHIPRSGVLVWTREEADAEAKQLAMIKSCVGQEDPHEGVPILTSKRFVNRFTRSPRTMAEAMRWRRDGRPAFGEPE